LLQNPRKIELRSADTFGIIRPNKGIFNVGVEIKHEVVNFIGDGLWKVSVEDGEIGS
jgi:hypothetical protein